MSLLSPGTIGIVLIAVTALVLMYRVLLVEKIQRGKATIVDKTFTKAHFELNPNYNNTDTLALAPTAFMHVPDQWRVTVQVDEQTAQISIPETLYKKLRKNRKVAIKYCYGKITGWLYVKELLVA